MSTVLANTITGCRWWWVNSKDGNDSTYISDGGAVTQNTVHRDCVKFGVL